MNERRATSELLINSSQFFHGGRDLFRDFIYLLFVCIRMSWPKKAAESVFFPPWNHVNMKMGNALADLVIDCHKSPLGVHGFLDCPAQKLRISEKRPDKGVWQVHKRFVMGSGKEQAVAVKKWAAVEERHAGFILQHHGGRGTARNDSAEFTVPFAVHGALGVLPYRVRNSLSSAQPLAILPVR